MGGSAASHATFGPCRARDRFPGLGRGIEDGSHLQRQPTRREWLRDKVGRRRSCLLPYGLSRGQADGSGRESRAGDHTGGGCIIEPREHPAEIGAGGGHTPRPRGSPQTPGGHALGFVQLPRTTSGRREPCAPDRALPDAAPPTHRRNGTSAPGAIPPARCQSRKGRPARRRPRAPESFSAFP